MRNNECTLLGVMFFPDDDTPVLGFGCLYVLLDWKMDWNNGMNYGSVLKYFP